MKCLWYQMKPKKHLFLQLHFEAKRQNSSTAREMCILVVVIGQAYRRDEPLSLLDTIKKQRLKQNLLARKKTTTTTARRRRRRRPTTTNYQVVSTSRIDPKTTSAYVIIGMGGGDDDETSAAGVVETPERTESAPSTASVVVRNNDG